MNYELKLGHVLEVLKEIPDESIQCVITSPPYYGLRQYGTDPQVWGGADTCQHIWGDAIPFAKSDKRTPEEKLAHNTKVGSNINFNTYTTNNTSGRFCTSCDAWSGELGTEPSMELYLDHLIEVFTEIRRVLKQDGVCFVNLGDSYNGTKTGNTEIHKNPRAATTNFKKHTQSLMLRKSLMNIPARFAIRMTDELKFVLRNEIIWHKPAAMPESVKDRFTRDTESIFFFAKNPIYKFNQLLEVALTGYNGSRFDKGKTALHHSGTVGKGERVDTGMRNKRTTWSVAFEPQKTQHLASYPTKLVTPMVLAGTDSGDTILDPFNGTATTGYVALKNGRKYVGIDLQPEYVEISKNRLAEFDKLDEQLEFAARHTE